MKNIKNNFIKVLFGIVLFSSVTACDEGGDATAGQTNTGQFAGDWFISLTDTDGDLVVDHALHSTYNTSANDNTMWIDDKENGYYIKAKFTINDDGTFSSPETDNLLDPGTTVTITDGKIEKDGAVSQGGHTVNKISFRVHFSYDPPGYDILYEGHKRTGFLEDEY
ncbi:lipid-binding protein [Flavobacterium antarcticum]|uniref:lipid-binding protein n=1 Tax=Flavobacterium antarcticum TaxID=271155 RepID=UPI000478B8BB|nr:lipid-binding protein [Flavobacterium antarcticum]